ncbi:hypothetical protein FB451DRAFT_1104070, partial [Mycena latifolia]
MHRIRSALVAPSIRRGEITTACSGLRRVLLAAKDVAGSVGVPGLTVAIGGLLLIVEVIQKRAQNAEDIEDLTKHLETLMTILSQASEAGAVPHGAKDRIARLASILTRVSDGARRRSTRGIFKRSWAYDQDDQWLRGQIQAMTWAIESFTVETSLHFIFMLDEHLRFVQDSTQTSHIMAVATQSAIQELSAKLEVRQGYLAHSKKAAFNSKERDSCSDSTRENILSDIVEWIYNDHSTTPSCQGHTGRIFWINGSAGTGKTTIASTVAKQCWDSDPKILGASFFCSRDDVECSNLSLIFPTLSYQLGIFNPLFASQVFRVLESNPDIAYASVHYQLEELIVKPLALVRNSFTRCIVILDALDECKDTATVSTVLSALSRFVMDLLPLKFLVTSRPETHITMGFAHPRLRPNTTQLLLHQVALPVVEADIHTYLSSRLATTRLLYKIQESWPPAGSVEALARLSAGLFIFASTSVKFIEDPFYSDPRHQLALLLENEPKLTGKSSPFHRLDQLYTEVLNLAYPDISHLHLRSLRTVLGSILHLRDPLSPTGLNSLLGLSIGWVKEALLRLHSLVIVPEDDEHCIRLIHPSFFDFLTDPARCAVPRFVVRFDEQNTLLALSCLRSLSQLSRDVCRIGKPWLLNSEVMDLPARIAVYLPAHVQYASRHWAHHVSASLVSDIILNALDKFCSEHLLHWVEVCSLLGELRQALLSVGDLHRILLGKSQVAKETLTLLRDCEHLIREFFPVISTSALQVYQSALLFAPDRALLQRTNDVEMDLQVRAYNVVEETWSPCETIIDGQAAFQCVEFSPDGTRIVSGCRDGNVQVWDASTGVHLQTMQGHSSTVTAVVFSPDGTRLLSGSKDTHVRLWDGGSGAHLWTFKGHSDAVESIAVCSTSSHIASGSQDRTIRLWDGDNGKHIRTLAEHSGPVLALAFSLDGKRLASGSADQTVRLWDVPQYGTHRILRRFPEWVLCIAFSSDGAHIAAGCSDQAVWICETGSHWSNPRVLKAHAGRVTSVSFSPDDRNIASGSMDHTVRIWDSASGTNLLTLEKHSAWVQSVAFSPDGTRVISASEDKTIRIWDVTRSAHLKGLKGTGSILAFSPDGTRVAVLDHEIKVLDVPTGGHLRTLLQVRDMAWVTLIAFSPNNMIVSALSDHSIVIWAPGSNKPAHRLRRHSDMVLAVVFSPTGDQMASGSADNTVC